MSGRRPLIGVTGGAGRLVPGWWFARRAIHRAGGRALRITPEAPQIQAALDGVIIGGGEDIASVFYEMFAYGAENPPDGGRDAFELAVIERMLAAGKPVLGICRGAQLINVARGGDLYEDLRARRRRTGHRRSLLPCKAIALRAGSRLADILGCRRCKVNSLHHQAVRRLGSGLRIGAVDADGIVQALEATDGSFLVGVQWHPEYLPWQRCQQDLFRALVDAAIAAT